jgi:hypothetical protein
MPLVSDTTQPSQKEQGCARKWSGCCCTAATRRDAWRIFHARCRTPPCAGRSSWDSHLLGPHGLIRDGSQHDATAVARPALHTLRLFAPIASPLSAITVTGRHAEPTASIPRVLPVPRAPSAQLMALGAGHLPALSRHRRPRSRQRRNRDRNHGRCPQKHHRPESRRSRTDRHTTDSDAFT